nr:uncharacterized protein LOC129435035 [Misgurnus anguillicaudatus]
MASEGKFHSRIYFLCPICKKAPRTLPGHLRTSCMQGMSEEEIKAVVVQSKTEMSEFSQNGRFWEYNRILEIFGTANPLASLLKEMDKKGLVVRNIPPIIHEPASYGQSSTRDAESEQSDEPAGPAEPEIASDISSEECYQSIGGPKWTSEVRVEMNRRGLYRKHPIDHVLLQGFFQFLRVDLNNKRSKQEVENVSRFMYYMNSKEPELLFVRDVEKVRQYFNVLTEAKLAKQTVLNYWKSLNRFMKYTLTSTNLFIKDKILYDECKAFIEPLNGIRNGMSKQINKELTQKRYHSYGKEKAPADCVAILNLARADFLGLVSKLSRPKSATLHKDDRLLFLYYLEAIVMLKLLQRPGVVSNMTVEEWQGRKRSQNGCSVAVKEHKTAASQVAELPLTAEQEHWFELYFEKIRPLMLQGPRSRDDTMAEEHFFISSSGRPIHNPSNDLCRLHTKYNITPVSSGDARMAFETAAKNMPEVERNAIARLLGHTPETAEKHYRMRTPADAFLAQRLLEEIAGQTRPGSSASTSQEQSVDVSERPGSSASTSQVMDMTERPGSSASTSQMMDVTETCPPKKDPYACFVMLQRLP